MNNLVTFCAVLLAVACHHAKAYDFQDADFNAILSSDLEEIIDSLDQVPLHPRARRDEDAANDDKCRKRHRGRKPSLCCADESFDAFHDKEKEHSSACFKEVTGMDKSEKHEHGPRHKKMDLFSCEDVEKRKSDMICIHECVGQKRGLLAEDGSPKSEQVTNYLKETLAKESWIDSAAEQIVSNCLAEAKNATEKPVKYYTENVKVCNPSGLTLKHCLFKEVQLNCPADQIKDKAACDKFQERIKKGMDFFGPPPPPFDEQPKDD